MYLYCILLIIVLPLHLSFTPISYSLPILISLHYILSSSSAFPLNLFKFVSYSLISFLFPIYCTVAPLVSLSFCYSFLYFLPSSNFPCYLCLPVLLRIHWMKDKISNISSSRNRNIHRLLMPKLAIGEHPESVPSKFQPDNPVS
jgi:hypothetical protein